MKHLIFIVLTVLLLGCSQAEGTSYYEITKVEKKEKGIKYVGYKTTPGRTGIRASFWSDSVRFQVGDTIYLNRKP